MLIIPIHSGKHKVPVALSIIRLHVNRNIMKLNAVSTQPLKWLLPPLRIVAVYVVEYFQFEDKKRAIYPVLTYLWFLGKFARMPPLRELKSTMYLLISNQVR